MNRKILIILIILLISSIAFSEVAHCWRQDITRVTRSYSATFGLDSNTGEFITGVGEYDYIVEPGTKYVFSGLQPNVWECDNGASLTQRDFGAIWDRLSGKILKTNSGDGTEGPKKITLASCVSNSGSICYIDKDGYQPAQGNCNPSGAIGAGDTPKIEYIFNDLDMGEHTITAEVGALSPATTNPYSSKIMYIAIPGSKQKIYVGSPSLLIFGPEQEIITSTYTTSGDIEITLLYTLMNRSFFNNRIVNYTLTCPSGITCTADQTYFDWLIASEEEMTIPVTIKIPRNTAPQEIAINMNLEFSTDGFTTCDPSLGVEGTNCHTQAEPTRIKVGLLDQQDFQVKSIDTTSSDYCTGPDGIVGVTGRDYAPKVNLVFGNAETDPLISIDECDEKDINNNDNPLGVYCSQLEFLIELARKVDAIATIREKIQELESAGKYLEADVLRQEENKYATFNPYLRAQDLSEALNTIRTLPAKITLANRIGLEMWSNTKSEQVDYLEALYNNTTGVEFVVSGPDGSTIAETNIEPGLYSARIDMNEIGEVTTSNYLFTAKTLNPTINIKVTLTKERAPKINWFFYEQGYNDNFKELFVNTPPTADGSSYTTNVDRRGEIIKFTEENGVISGGVSFFRTYAYPLFVAVKGGPSGITNTKIDLVGTTGSTVGFVNQDTLTYWSGFASSLGDGCDTTSTAVLKKFLPYRIPDIASNDSFYLHDPAHSLASVTPNSTLLLNTVFYLPYTPGSTQSLDLTAQMPLYHPTGTCTTPPCEISIQESMSDYKVNDLESVLEGINNNTVCVQRELDGVQQKNKWTLFWNESEILVDLNTMAQGIGDVEICKTYKSQLV